MSVRQTARPRVRFPRTAEIYEGRRKTGTLVSTLKAACLPGFELPLADLFAVLDD